MPKLWMSTQPRYELRSDSFQIHLLVTKIVLKPLKTSYSHPIILRGKREPNRTLQNQMHILPKIPHTRARTMPSANIQRIKYQFWDGSHWFFWQSFLRAILGLWLSNERAHWRASLGNFIHTLFANYQYLKTLWPKYEWPRVTIKHL